MRKICRYASRATALFLLATTATSTHVEVTTKDIGSIGATATPPATCPSRSINYITHSLPQQCLTTSWAGKPSVQQTSAHDVKQTADASVHDSHGSKDETIVADTTTKESVQILPSTQPTLVRAPVDTESQDLGFSGSTSPTAKEPTEGVQTIPETETDSPLDNANFLSFEEWKKQNLAKAGQSAENWGVRAGDGGHEPRRRPGGINNALDSLGEDIEIEIDFSGFVNPATSMPTVPPGKTTPENYDSVETEGHVDGKAPDEPSGGRRRSNDAGKTCMERSNYASFDCAATILKTNPECKGPNAVLVENKDSYMLNLCSAKNKFFIVELCDDILIDTVVLANFEFFSSMFRTFRVSVSDRYPVKLDKWKELGTFEARNSREVQAFLVENPLIWARYLRIEVLTHFGNEYYCPISLMRVHGTTMMEEFNHDLKRSGTEDESESETGEGELETTGVVTDPKTAQPLDQALVSSLKLEGGSSDQPSKPTAGALNKVPTNVVALGPDASVQSGSDREAISAGFTPYDFSISRSLERVLLASNGLDSVCKPDAELVNIEEVPSVPCHEHQPASTVRAMETSVAPISTQTSSTDNAVPTSPDSTHVPESSAAVSSAESNRSSLQTGSEPVRLSNKTSTNTVKIQASSTLPPVPNPTTQESFFKSVHKRLQLLESNSTLSLQYIEEQSRILRDAFSKVEKRQFAKTSTFLETLNTTVLTELREFRTQYDQIWQSTVLELSSQREQSQHEVLALTTRLSMLADEIVFQKRMAILQFILILLCLGLVIFSRQGSSANYLELPPLVQNAINRASANLSRYTPHFETPPASPPSTRPSSRYGLLKSLTHYRDQSDESQLSVARDGAKSPNIEHSPPTPTSESSPNSSSGTNAKVKVDTKPSGAALEVNSRGIRHTKSSPATPNGQRDDSEGYIAKAMLDRNGYTENQAYSSDGNVTA